MENFGEVVDSGTVSGSGTYLNLANGRTELLATTSEALLSTFTASDCHNYVIVPNDLILTYTTGRTFPAGKTLIVNENVTLSFKNVNVKKTLTFRFVGNLINYGTIEKSADSTFETKIDFFAATLDNYGTINDDGEYLKLYQSTTFNNHEGATYTHAGDNTDQQVIVDGKFVNDGTLNHSGQVFCISEGARFTNNGTINVIGNNSPNTVVLDIEDNISGDGRIIANDYVERDASGNETLRKTVQINYNYPALNTQNTFSGDAHVLVSDLECLISAMSKLPQYEITINNAKIVSGETITIPENANVVMSSRSSTTYPLTLDGTLIVNGKLTLDTNTSTASKSIVNGRLQINAGGELEIKKTCLDNYGTVENHGTFKNVHAGSAYRNFVNSESSLRAALSEPIADKIVLYDDVTLANNLTVPSGIELVIPEGETLVVPQGKELTVAEGGTLNLETNGIIKLDYNSSLLPNGTFTDNGIQALVVSNEAELIDAAAYDACDEIFVDAEISLTENIDLTAKKLVLLENFEILPNGNTMTVTDGNVIFGVASESELVAAITSNLYPVKTVSDFSIANNVEVPVGNKPISIGHSVTIANGKMITNGIGVSGISFASGGKLTGIVKTTVNTVADFNAALNSPNTYIVIGAPITLSAQTVINEGYTVEIPEGQTLTCSYKLTSYGKIKNFGDLEFKATSSRIYGAFESYGSVTVTKSLTIEESCVFDNFGRFVNNSTFYVYGVYNNNNKTTVNYSFYVYGKLNNKAATINGTPYNGVMTINAAKTLTVQGTLVNDGTITNNGTIDLNIADSKLTNNAVLTNNGKLLFKKGTVVLNSGSNLTNGETGVFEKYAYTETELNADLQNMYSLVTAGATITCENSVIIPAGKTLNLYAFDVTGTFAGVVGSKLSISYSTRNIAGMNCRFYNAEGVEITTTTVGTYAWDASLNGWKMEPAA